MPDVTVRFKVLDGTWETCGPGRDVWPENFSASADEFGFKACSFDLKRDPSRPWPDLLPFTPVEVEVDGLVVWEGRTIEAPSRDGAEKVMSVQCEGWQHHLDDDLVDLGWVHTRLADWKDSRSFPDTPLNFLKAAPTVTTGNEILMGWPTGTESGPSDSVGVTFDLGPDRRAKRVVIEFENKGFAGGTFGLYGCGNDHASEMIAAGDAFSVDVAGSSPLAGTFGTPRRFVSVLVYKTAPSTVTETADRMVKIKAIRLFCDAANESGNTSVLKASDVVRDTLAETTLLSADVSGVEDSATAIPEFWPDGLKTPRETINAINGLQGNQFKIGAGKRPIYRALPDRPIFTVGDWSAVEVQDAASNSGVDLFNKVVVTGTDPGGQPVRVERRASFVDPDGFRSDPSLVWPNPSFATNTTDWSSGGGTLTRTTTSGEYDTGPAGGKFVSTTLLGYAETDANGNLVPGKTYRARVRVKAAASPTTCFFGLNYPTAGPYVSISNFILGTSWETIELYYTARAGDGGVRFRVVVIGSPSPKTIYLDSLQIDVASKTVVDRRGFSRGKELQVNSTLPTEGVLAAALGDRWLRNHANSPFKGSCTLTGPEAVRGRQSGQPVPAARLLRETGQLIHFSDRVDPVTGANGVNGRITEVRWSADSDTAEVTLDNSRMNFEVLLSRIAVAQG